MRRGFAIITLGVLAACQPAEPDQTAEAPAETTAPPPILANDLLIRHDGPDLGFRWSAPADAALEPDLFRAIQADGKQALQHALDEAKTGQEEAAKAGFPYRRYEFDQRWKPEAETPQLLALSLEGYSYTGGAHGMTAYATAIWDRKVHTRLGSWDLFTDREKAQAALTPVWCEQLDAERARRRMGAKITGFDDCPPVGEMVLVPVGYPQIWALKIIAGPYAAGPYAEGAYEISISPPETLLSLVKPEYRDAFVG